VALTQAPVLDQAALQRILRIGGPALLRNLAGMYLELGPGRLQALADGVAAGDADQVRRAAHTMKSTAGNVGAVRLQHSAEHVEQLASEGVIDADAAARIRREFDESATALRGAVEELGP
jgi:HPt (histidine-containing phosphotransfer) domain-containing protein